MKLIYRDLVYECVSAEKKQNEIVIHTGKYYDDGEEISYQILGDINFDEVILEGGTWTESSASSAEPTQLDRVEAQATYTAMITDTLLECY